jgi:hypothetical protein
MEISALTSSSGAAPLARRESSPIVAVDVISGASRPRRRARGSKAAIAVVASANSKMEVTIRRAV